MSNFEDFDLRRGPATNGRPRPQSRNMDRDYDVRPGRSQYGDRRGSDFSYDLEDEVDMYDEYGEYDEYEARRANRASSASGRRPAASHSSSGRSAGHHSSGHSGARKSASRSSASRGGRSSSSRSNSSRAKATRNTASRRPAPARRGSGGRNGNGGDKRKKRRTVIVVEVVLLLVLVVIFFFWNKFGKVNWDNLKMEDVEVNKLDEETLGVLDGYTTYAFFGVDNRSNGDLDKGRSDTIMLVSINKETNDVKMVSVQRDTLLRVNGDSYGKCNSAYMKGRKTALEMLNTNLDLQIDGYVSVDFLALASIVDALGGLDLEVTQKMIDTKDENGLNDLGGKIAEVEHVLKYAPDKKDYFNPEDCTFDSPGIKHMNGAQVVGYCRVRYSVGDDYGRAENQRKVLKLVLEKAKNANIAQLNKIADDVFPKISTNIPKTEIIAMAASASKFDVSESNGFPFDLKSMTVGKKGSCVVPCTLESNVVKLHKLLYNQDDYNPTEEVKGISSHIQSETGCSESSAVKTQEPDKLD